MDYNWIYVSMVETATEFHVKRFEDTLYIVNSINEMFNNNDMKNEIQEVDNRPTGCAQQRGGCSTYYSSLNRNVGLHSFKSI